MSEQVDQWPKGTRILVILAHPDDPEFFMGGTIARWVEAGYEVQYMLLTKGEKGINPGFPEGEALGVLRVEEQKAAAAVLGVSKVEFLDYSDGYLEPDLDKRRVVTRIIRKVKPQIVASCDPLNYYIGDRYLNHPDHRAAGQVVVDSVFPAAINNAFFPELIKEGLPAVKVLELWLSLPQKPNVSLDVEEYWEKRKLALLEHKSQIGEPADFLKHIEARKKESNNESAHYQEYFRRILF